VTNLPLDRDMAASPECHGFRRTECACEFCQVPCRHVPGGLDVADLGRLCPQGQDVFAWSEQHLRARTDRAYPILVPARQANGHCHWHFDGRCVVHEHAPYGCAFFDSHMPQPEIDRRYAVTVRARQNDAASDGLYYRVWSHLCRKGLIEHPGDSEALMEDVRRIRCQAERSRRRSRHG
jgi:hypothetical protein